jgi:SAM-dependent methyltransferase
VFAGTKAVTEYHKIQSVDRMLEETYRAEQRHFWFRGFRRFIQPFLSEAVSGVRRPRLLDCGCGTGANLQYLRQFGVAYGIDLTWRGLQFGREHGLTRLAQASVASLPIADHSIDAAVSFDVLYCLEDDVEKQAIAEMHRVLRQGGALVVNVAALNMLSGDHSALGAEVRRYTREGLRAKLQDAGFAITRMTYTNAALFPLTATVRALQRLRGIRPEGGRRGDFYVPPAPINAVLSGMLTLESRAIAAGIDMPIGSSVLCLARKV